MHTPFLLLGAIALGTAAPAAGAQDADQARRELDRLNAEAQAQAAADRARMAREEAQRLEARARAEGDARQRALAAEYERRRSEGAAQAQAAEAEADLIRRAAEQRLRAAETDAGRAAAQTRSAASAPTAPLQPSTTAARRRGPAPVRSDAAPVAVIAMKEAVTLCQREGGERWRCTGPLRVAYGDIRTSRAAAVDACGAAPIRELGSVRGLRAFACGYGLNPRSSAPGNRDVPALFGIEVPGRISFRCRADLPAGCRSR
jgi:hypothetical protein